MAKTSITQGSSQVSPAIGPHRLPAPHDRVEFRICVCGVGMNARCAVDYSGSVEDLIAAGVVTLDLLTKGKSGATIPSRGRVTRRDKAGGRIWVSFRKYEIVVDFHNALERGLSLPGVTDEILTAARAEAFQKHNDYAARCAAGRAPPAPEDEPEPNSVHIRVGAELARLSMIADDDATSEDLIALMPEFKAKLLARKAKRDAERRRPSYLRLVVDNGVWT